MVKKQVLNVVKFFEDRLKEHGLQKFQIVVFGSHASGRFHPGSDIDIAIISDEFDGKDIFERARMTKDAEILTVRTDKIPLDIITLSPKEFNEGRSPVVEYVKQGTVVLSRSTSQPTLHS